MRDNVTKMTFDDMLSAALNRASAEEYRELGEYERSEDAPALSAEFDRRMQRLIHDTDVCGHRPVSRLRHRKGRRALLIAAVLVMVFAGTAMAVEPVRERLAQGFITIFGGHADISTTEEGHGDDASAFCQYFPDTVPEGYCMILNECSEETQSSDIVYENEDGDTIAFSQVASDKISMDITSDGRTMEEISVRGVHGYYLTDTEVSSIVWEEDGYIFTISSQCERRKLVSLAEGLRPVD